MSEFVIGAMAVTSTPSPQAMTQSPVTNQIPVGTTATKLCAGANDLANRKQIMIYNLNTATTLYIGGAGVTTGNGFPIPPGGSYGTYQNPASTAPIYGIVASGTIQVAVLEVA